MSEANTFDSFPDISFIDDMSLEDAMSQMKGWYEERYEELTGMPLTLSDADPEKIRLDTISYMYYQTLVYLDFMAKQNLLKYSTSYFLDNIGARCGLVRKKAEAATVMICFTLSAAQNEAYLIPAGTRCTAGDDVFFSVIEDTEIPAGTLSLEIKCECTVAGSDGNEYEVWEINSLVDLLSYVQTVSNTEKPDGGSDEESDDAFAERIYLSPSSFNTAGVEDAYIFWTKSANNEIGDVIAYSPEPCYVTIIFIMKDGSLPEQTMIDKVKECLNERSKKVLGDRLEVKAPNVREFDIDLTYYINESDRKISSQINEEVAGAIEEYKKWQCEKIGRDINPSKLEHLIMLSGAKRVEIRSPVFTKVEDSEIPLLSSSDVIYGGIEDD